MHDFGAKDADPKRQIERWDKWGLPESRLDYYRALFHGTTVWMFGKGKSFNKDFEWDQVGDHPVVGVTQACGKMPRIDLALTYDDTIRFQILNEFKIPREKLIGSYKAEWPRPFASGDFAFIVLGELGVKKLKVCGMCGSFKNEWEYGFDYSDQGPKEPDELLINIRKRITNAIAYRIKNYGMTVTVL